MPPAALGAVALGPVTGKGAREAPTAAYHRERRLSGAGTGGTRIGTGGGGCGT